MSKADVIKQSFLDAIQIAKNNKDEYVMHPGKDFTRERDLPFEQVVKYVLSLTGNSNTIEFRDFCKENGIDATASAAIQQRNKLKENLFVDILRNSNSLCIDSRTFKGYSILAVDGTDLNISRNPKSKSYIANASAPNGYNQLHISVLYDVLNKTYVDVVIQPKQEQNEHTALIEMLERNHFAKKTLIIMDRGYEAFNNFAHFYHLENVDFLCRIKNGYGCINEVKELSMPECDITQPITITNRQTNEAKKNGWHYINNGSTKGKQLGPNTKIRRWDYESPYKMNIRLVRVQLSNGECEALATSLNKQKFPLEDMQELYHMRWGIETSFRELKYSIGLVNLHSKKEQLVKQEIIATLVMYNFCERITNSVVIYQYHGREHAYQVNFTMSIHICREFFRKRKPSRTIVETEIAKYSLPIRPGRQDKRKIKPKSFVAFIYRVAA